MARPICLRLLLHDMRAAASRTFCTAGSSRPIRMAMMAITTNNSINVKPARRIGEMESISMFLNKECTQMSPACTVQTRASFQVERLELVSTVLDFGFELRRCRIRVGSFEAVSRLWRRCGDHLFVSRGDLLGTDDSDDVLAGRGSLLLPHSQPKRAVLVGKPNGPDSGNLINTLGME